LSQVGTMLGFGLSAGMALAAGAGASLRSLLFGTPIADPAALIIASGVITFVSLAAVAAPVRRAAAADPIVLLNAE
jgi:ABC-type antimicrobial peptide transport system permease subunit